MFWNKRFYEIESMLANIANTLIRIEELLKKDEKKTEQDVTDLLKEIEEKR